MQVLPSNDEILAVSDSSKMSDSFLPLSMEDDFASSIFSQLPPDLQQVLGVANTQGKCSYSVSFIYTGDYVKV